MSYEKDKFDEMFEITMDPVAAAILVVSLSISDMLSGIVSQLGSIAEGITSAKVGEALDGLANLPESMPDCLNISESLDFIAKAINDK